MEPTGPRERGPMTGSTKSGAAVARGKTAPHYAALHAGNDNLHPRCQTALSRAGDVSQIYYEVNYNIHFVVDYRKQDPGSG
jgi:hypothetical protein